MVRLEESKHLTEGKNIESLPLPGRVYIPLSQHLGKICTDLEVSIGDEVFAGQRIASVKAHVYSPIHASISGKVIAVEDWPHPLLGRSKAVVIEGDGLNKSGGLTPRSENEISVLTAEEIRNIVFEAGIVGMGGASFPTHIKLTPPKPVGILLINGAECEPFLTGDSRLMIEKAKEIIKGIELVLRCIGAKNAYVAIESNKPEAIDVFRKQLSGTGYILKILKSYYPQGGEKQLIKNILGKEVPRGKLPFDVGVVVHNVATVYAIYEAVYLKKPLYERVLTMTGDCLEKPGNFLVRIGTTIKDLLSNCGPLKQEPQKIIFGGPMMGIAQFSLDTPVIKSTNGIIFLSKTESKSAEASFCIRCSRCVQQCPVGLMPCMIALASEKEKWDLSKAYGCLDCMECGLCNYVCPQKINMVQLIKYAKSRLPK